MNGKVRFAVLLMVCFVVCGASSPSFVEGRSFARAFECVDAKGKAPTTCEACAALKAQGVSSLLGGNCYWCVRDGPDGYRFDKGDCVSSRLGCLKGGVSFDLDKCKEVRKDRETSKKEVDEAVKKMAAEDQAQKARKADAMKKEDDELVKREKDFAADNKKKQKDAKEQREQLEKQRAELEKESRKDTIKFQTGAAKETACKDGCYRDSDCQSFCSKYSKDRHMFAASTATDVQLQNACSFGCSIIRSFPKGGSARYREQKNRKCDRQCFDEFTTVDWKTRREIEKVFEGDMPVDDADLYAANAKGFRLAASCRDGCNAKCPKGRCVWPEDCKKTCYGFVEKQSDAERSACIFGCELLDQSNYKSKEVSGSSEFFCRNECARFG